MPRDQEQRHSQNRSPDCDNHPICRGYRQMVRDCFAGKAQPALPPVWKGRSSNSGSGALGDRQTRQVSIDRCPGSANCPGQFWRRSQSGREAMGNRSGNQLCVEQPSHISQTGRSFHRRIRARDLGRQNGSGGVEEPVSRERPKGSGKTEAQRLTAGFPSPH